MLYIIILLKYIILDVRKISRKEAKKYGQSLLKKQLHRLQPEGIWFQTRTCSQ